MIASILKWIGIVLAGIVGIIILIVIGTNIAAESRLSRVYTVPAAALTVPGDAAAVERGRHWANVLCTGCHGANLAGQAFFDVPPIGKIPAANLTGGKGGTGAFTDADWERAIRHGVGPDGKALFIMPSTNFYYFSDRDLGDIVSYLKSVPKVDNEQASPSVTPLGKTMFALGMLGLPAESINHDGPRPDAVQPGKTEAYGAYLSRTTGCRECHGQTLAGGQGPEPGAPPAPNLTPGGALKTWDEAGFVKAMRTGITPDGHQLSEAMPWKEFGQMTDTELGALWLHLKALQPRETTR